MYSYLCTARPWNNKIILSIMSVRAFVQRTCIHYIVYYYYALYIIGSRESLNNIICDERDLGKKSRTKNTRKSIAYTCTERGICKASITHTHTKHTHKTHEHTNTHTHIIIIRANDIILLWTYINRSIMRIACTMCVSTNFERCETFANIFLFLICNTYIIMYRCAYIFILLLFIVCSSVHRPTCGKRIYWEFKLITKGLIRKS